MTKICSSDFSPSIFFSFIVVWLNLNLTRCFLVHVLMRISAAWVLSPWLVLLLRQNNLPSPHIPCHKALYHSRKDKKEIEAIGLSIFWGCCVSCSKTGQSQKRGDLAVLPQSLHSNVLCALSVDGNCWDTESNEWPSCQGTYNAEKVPDIKVES